MQNVVYRIKSFIDHKGISVSAFERSIGMSNASYRNSLKTGGTIGSDKLERIMEVYPELSPRWLLRGEGPMCEDQQAPQVVLTNDPTVGSPFYDVDFEAGFDEIINSQVTNPDCRIIVPGFAKADLWCNVTGHSMEPKISHGDIVALRKCTVDDIQYGEIYAVVLDTIRTIKILRRGSAADRLLFVPINRREYDDQEFPISRIINIFEVLGSISKFF